MFDAPAVRLAVARLMEAGGAAPPCRHRPDRPLEGYCMVSGDEQNCRITIYVENGRTLSDRTGGPFYYEGWLLTDEGPVSAGAFNTGTAGDGSITMEPGAGLASRATGVRVTAEPLGGSLAGHAPVLEGALVWLQGQPATPARAEARAEAQESMVAEPVGALAVGAPWAGLLAGAGAVAYAEPPAGSGPEREPEGPEPGPDFEPLGRMPQPQPEPEQQPQPPAPQPEPRAQAEPQPEAPEQDSTIGFKLYPEPATLVTKVTPVTLNVPLNSQHPMAPRALGAAVLHLRDGQVNLTLRGLPSPAALGRDPATNRPYNGYRAWLVHQRTGQRTPLGLCQRLWGEHYKLESEPGLHLGRHDALVVTACDRAEEAPDPSAPRVMLGTYETA